MKIRRYRFYMQYFKEFFENGKSYTITEGLPKSSKIVNSYLDIDKNCFTIIVEDESFDHVPDGNIIPEYVSIRRLTNWI